MKPPWTRQPAAPGTSYQEKSTSVHHCSVSNGFVPQNATTASVASGAGASASMNACVV
jgi:hypothetical protein